MIGRVYLQTAEPDPQDVLGLGRSRRLYPPRTVMVMTRAEPFSGAGPARNVLVQPLERRRGVGGWVPVGQPYVRPFRGLRRLDQ